MKAPISIFVQLMVLGVFYVSPQIFGTLDSLTFGSFARRQKPYIVKIFVYISGMDWIYE